MSARKPTFYHGWALAHDRPFPGLYFQNLVHSACSQDSENWSSSVKRLRRQASRRRNSRKKRRNLFMAVLLQFLSHFPVPPHIRSLASRIVRIDSQRVKLFP